MQVIELALMQTYSSCAFGFRLGSSARLVANLEQVLKKLRHENRHQKN